MKTTILSIIAIAISLLALYLTCFGSVVPSQTSLVLSILSILVTALIGWQIFQVISFEDRINQIAKDSTDKIMEDIFNDIHSINTALMTLNNHAVSIMTDSVPDGKKIHDLMLALDLQTRSKHPNNVAPVLNTLSSSLQDILRSYQGNQELHLLKGQESFYESVLQRVNKCKHVQGKLSLPTQSIFDLEI